MINISEVIRKGAFDYKIEGTIIVPFHCILKDGEVSLILEKEKELKARIIRELVLLELDTFS